MASANVLRVGPAMASESVVSGWSVARVHVFGGSAVGWRVEQPLPVSVRCAGNRFVVSDALFDVFGEGATWDEAEQDYVASLIDYFLLMDDDADPASQAVAAHLRVYLRPA